VHIEKVSVWERLKTPRFSLHWLTSTTEFGRIGGGVSSRIASTAGMLRSSFWGSFRREGAGGHKRRTDTKKKPFELDRGKGIVPSRTEDEVEKRTEKKVEFISIEVGERKKGTHTGSPQEVKKKKKKKGLSKKDGGKNKKLEDMLKVLLESKPGRGVELS